jgi:hypothetical protein
MKKITIKVGYFDLKNVIYKVNIVYAIDKHIDLSA